MLSLYICCALNTPTLYTICFNTCNYKYIKSCPSSRLVWFEGFQRTVPDHKSKLPNQNFRLFIRLCEGSLVVHVLLLLSNSFFSLTKMKKMQIFIIIKLYTFAVKCFALFLQWVKLYFYFFGLYGPISGSDIKWIIAIASFYKRSTMMLGGMSFLKN